MYLTLCYRDVQCNIIWVCNTCNVINGNVINSNSVSVIFPWGVKMGVGGLRGKLYQFGGVECFWAFQGSWPCLSCHLRGQIPQGFFFFLGVLGVPRGDENFAHPPTDCHPPPILLEPVLPWVLCPKMSKMLPHSSLNFGYFLAQNCIRKLYFMLKTPKFCSNFAVGKHFWPQWTICPSPPSPHLTPSPTGTEDYPKSKCPTKNFVKQPCPPPWQTI